MFRSLARSIMVTGLAYSVVSLIGLLIAPFLIARFGLAGYGQILLARLVLPTATFGFLDLGIGETATRAVAEANRTRDWRKAAEVLSLLVLLALSVSAIVALITIAFAQPIPGWLAIAPGERHGFTRVLLLTAALEPLLFLSMVAEGVLKGFERFKRVRSCEVVSALVYGGAAVILALAGLGPNWVSVALLTGLFVRVVMASGSAIILLRRKQVRLTRWSVDTRREVLAWSRLMFFNKVLGTLQTQVATPLIGFLIGPAAVGAYDAVVRLPRFAKSIFGLLSTTVLPFATGLKAEGDEASLSRLGRYGTLASLVITVPPLVLAIAYSKVIMHYWVGDLTIDFWGWQSAMFVVPILNVATTFGGSILLADRGASEALLRWTAAQVIMQLVVSLAFVPLLHQWSFVLGPVLSNLLVFPFQFAVIRRSLQLDRMMELSFALLVFVSAVSAAGVHLLVPTPNLMALLAISVVFCTALTAICPWLVLKREERRVLFARLGSAAKLEYLGSRRAPLPDQPRMEAE